MTLGNWEFLLVLAGLFILFRVAFLQSRIWYLQRMHKRWKAHVTSSPDAEHISHEDMPKFKRALLEAKVGIEKMSVKRTRPLGYGYVDHPSIQLIDNICVVDEEITPSVNVKIGEAIGAYRLRRNDTVNPIHWVIALWNLPQSIAGSFGMNKNAWPIRVFQLIYKLAVVGGFLLKALNVWQKYSRQIM